MTLIEFLLLNKTKVIYIINLINKIIYLRIYK